MLLSTQLFLTSAVVLMSVMCRCGGARRWVAPDRVRPGSDRTAEVTNEGKTAGFWLIRAPVRVQTRATIWSNTSVQLFCLLSSLPLLFSFFFFPLLSFTAAYFHILRWKKKKKKGKRKEGKKRDTNRVRSRQRKPRGVYKNILPQKKKRKRGLDCCCHGKCL